MVKIVGGVEVEFYSTPEDMPIKRWNRFNKYMMNSVEIGNTINDYDLRNQNIIGFLKAKEYSKAIQEFQNRRNTFWNAISEYNPDYEAIALLVKRIGDEVFQGRDLTNVKKIKEKLDELELSKKKMTEYINEAKTSIQRIIDIYHPDKKAKYNELVFGSHQKKKMLREFDIMIGNGKFEGDEELDRISQEYYREKTVNNWNTGDPDNVDREFEVSFDKLLIHLQSEVNQASDDMSIMRFLASLEIIKDKNKPK